MASVYFDPAVGGNGTTVTDDSNATTGLANGGHRTRFVPALAQVVAVAANVVSTAGASSASAVASAASAASAATIYDNFDDRYLGPKAVAPILDNDGNTLVTGALYFHTAGGNPGFRVWDGASWLEPAGSIQPDFNILREVHTATSGQTVFNLTNSYVVGTNAIMVYQNGSRLLNTDYTETSSTQIVLTTGATAGDELMYEIGVAVLGGVQTATNTSFTPTGTISSTNVQAALAELDSEKQPYDVNTAKLNVQQNFTKPQRPSLQAETSPISNTITWDLTDDQVFQCNLDANITTFNLTGTLSSLLGNQYQFIVRFNGGSTIAWNSNFKWPSATAPTLTGTSGKIDIFNFVVGSTDGGTTCYLFNTGKSQNMGA